MNETKEFPQGKENYCPRCYFENEKVGRRLDCPHQRESFTTPQGTKDWRERVSNEVQNELPMMYCQDAESEIINLVASELSIQAQEIVDDVQRILTDEIATAHTTTSGKTSRLTSAYNRISKLKQKYGK